jgi:hypothetical protein
MKQKIEKGDSIIETNPAIGNAPLSLMSFYQDPDDQIDPHRVAIHARDSEHVANVLIGRILQNWGDILFDNYVSERSRRLIIPKTEEFFGKVFSLLALHPDEGGEEVGMTCDEEPQRETEDSWIRSKMRTKNEGFKNRISAAERQRVHEHAVVSDKRALQIAKEKCWKFLTDAVHVEPKSIYHDEDTDPLDEQMRAYKSLIQAQETEKQQHILAQEQAMTVLIPPIWLQLIIRKKNRKTLDNCCMTSRVANHTPLISLVIQCWWLGHPLRNSLL